MLSTKQVCLFLPALKLRGHPAPEDVETPDGVGEVAVGAVELYHLGSLSHSKSYSRA